MRVRRVDARTAVWFPFVESHAASERSARRVACAAGDPRGMGTTAISGVYTSAGYGSAPRRTARRPRCACRYRPVVSPARTHSRGHRGAAARQRATRMCRCCAGGVTSAFLCMRRADSGAEPGSGRRVTAERRWSPHHSEKRARSARSRLAAGSGGGACRRSSRFPECGGYHASASERAVCACRSPRTWASQNFPFFLYDW